jgi:hypothetical protein
MVRMMPMSISMSLLSRLNIIYPFIFKPLLFEFTLVFKPHDLKRHLAVVDEDGRPYFQVLDQGAILLRVVPYRESFVSLNLLIVG